MAAPFAFASQLLGDVNMRTVAFFAIYCARAMRVAAVNKNQTELPPSLSIFLQDYFARCFAGSSNWLYNNTSINPMLHQASRRIHMQYLPTHNGAIQVPQIGIGNWPWVPNVHAKHS